MESFKDVNISHGGKCPDECMSICFNIYITYYFPPCVQTRGTGPKLNAWRNRQFSTASPKYLKGVTRVIPSIIGLIFNKTLDNILWRFLEIGILLLRGNYVPTLRKVGRPQSPRKLSTKRSQAPEEVLGSPVQV